MALALNNPRRLICHLNTELETKLNHWKERKGACLCLWFICNKYNVCLKRQYRYLILKHMYTHWRACVNSHAHTHTCTQTYTHTHTQTHTHIYIYICLSINLMTIKCNVSGHILPLLTPVYSYVTRKRREITKYLMVNVRDNQTRDFCIFEKGQSVSYRESDK